MKKITHRSIADKLNISSSAVTQRINSGRGFSVKEAISLSCYFNTPLEAWADIKSFITTSSHKNKELQDV